MILKKWWDLLTGNRPQPKAANSKIKIGSSLRVKSKGHQRIEYISATEVHVYADDPDITAPPGMMVKIYPAKK